MYNLEGVQAVVAAAEDEGSPAILQVWQYINLGQSVIILYFFKLSRSMTATNAINTI